MAEPPKMKDFEHLGTGKRKAYDSAYSAYRAAQRKKERQTKKEDSAVASAEQQVIAGAITERLKQIGCHRGAACAILESELNS